MAAAEHLRASSASFRCDVPVRQLPLDELYAVVREVKSGTISADDAVQRLERSPSWVWTALEPQSTWLLVIDVGTRTLAMAQRMVHQAVQRLAPDCAPLLLTDGLQDDGTACLTHVCQWMQPARRRDKGARPQPGWMPVRGAWPGAPPWDW